MVLIALLLFALFLAGLSLRPSRGPAPEETVSLDNLILFSERYRLTGRPDRIVRIDGHYIPEEWKKAVRPQHHHATQLAVYMLLIEEHYGIRPPYSVLITGDGRHWEVSNTEDLRSE